MAIGVLVFGLGACGTEGNVERAAGGPLSARIELDAQTVTGGETIDGRVIVDNTGEEIQVVGCGSIFQVALTNDQVEPQIGWDDCSEEFTIPSGESGYPVIVRVHHLGCVAGSVPEDFVPCEADGRLPPLPPGDYEARLYQRSDVVPEPSPALVRVVSDRQDGDSTTTEGRAERVVVFMIDSETFQGGDLGSEHLVAVEVAVPETVDDPARIEAALRAAAAPTPEQRDAGLRSPLRPEAVPKVAIEDTVAVIDWHRTRASQELGIWSTSSGSLGLWPIIGMVFENAPEVAEIEHRLDGSCEVFTAVMQGADCQRHTRKQWAEYTDP